MLTKRGQQIADGIDDRDRIRSRLTLNGQRHDLLAVIATGEAVVLNAIDDLAKIAQSHRRAVSISYDQLSILFGVGELTISLHGQVLMNPVKRADRHIRVATLQSSRHIIDADAARSERRRIDLHAHRILLFTSDQHLRNPTDR